MNKSMKLFLYKLSIILYIIFFLTNVYLIRMDISIPEFMRLIIFVIQVITYLVPFWYIKQDLDQTGISMIIVIFIISYIMIGILSAFFPFDSIQVFPVSVIFNCTDNADRWFLKNQVFIF
jgi:heme/copper-type cytochrome/quinol oxidase subunit 4